MGEATAAAEPVASSDHCGSRTLASSPVRKRRTVWRLSLRIGAEQPIMRMLEAFKTGNTQDCGGSCSTNIYGIDAQTEILCKEDAFPDKTVKEHGLPAVVGPS